ncbi:MAG TPA: PAAR domain-containing protein [Candidatus Koribacter sp.]|jgi:hypothetical protein
MPMAARITDQTTHGTPLSPGPGSADVLIGSLPAWRTQIDIHACPAVSVSGADGVGQVMMGSPTVFIDSQMACRQLDIVVETPGLAMGPVNPILMGCPTVIIGEAGMGGMETPMANEMVAANAAGIGLVSTSSAASAVSGGAAAAGSAAPALSGVSAAEIASAASPGIAGSQIAAREKVAQAFLQQQGGMDAAAAEAHMSGMDMTQPVVAGTNPPPLSQASAPGQSGSYFGDASSTPAALGEGSQALDSKTNEMVSKAASQYAAKPGSAYLKSQAKKAVDSWAAPLNSACPSPLKDQALNQITQGAGKQYYVPAKNALSKVGG